MRLARRIRTMQQRSIARMLGLTANTKKQKTTESVDVPAAPVEVPGSRLFSFLQEPSWRAALAPEVGSGQFLFANAVFQTLQQFHKDYMQKLEALLSGEKGKVFPPEPLIFAALNATPLSAVRVCVIGQDPYHAAGQAMGLAFSVPRGVAVPSSLQNIYKELAANEPTFKRPPHGDLTEWAQRGVLLLNTSLTVREAQPGSHAKQGWETFTSAIVQLLSVRPEPIVFLLVRGACLCWIDRSTRCAVGKARRNQGQKHPRASLPAQIGASQRFVGIQGLLWQQTL